MSKHKDKDKERIRDERRSRERERSRDKERRKRSRSRSKDKRSHKKSKDKDRERYKGTRSRSRSRKSSRRDRSRDRDRDRDRSRGHSKSREYSKRRRHERSPEKRSRSKNRRSRSESMPVPPAKIMRPSTSSAAQASTSYSATNKKSRFGQHSILEDQPTVEDLELFDKYYNKNLDDDKDDEDSDGDNGPDPMENLSPGTVEMLNDFLRSDDEGDDDDDDDDNEEGTKKARKKKKPPKSKRKRKSRWASTNDATEGKTFIPGMPTILPSNLNSDQQEAYLVQIQIEEITRKLKTGDLGVSAVPEERSPSPEPVYSSDGKRLNTREFRTRKKLEEQRHSLITRMQSMNPEFKPPSDYKPPVLRVSDKVLIPQEEHPDINFVGLLIGPRGNTLKAMEKETGAKIIIRGKGSVKEGKVGRKDGQPLPGEDEPLHAFITASTPESVNKAVEKIKEVIRQGIEVPEGCNDLRRMQLRELAQLNGTLRETDGMRCSNCGSTEHKSWLCPDKPNVTNNIVCSACGGAGHIAKDCKSKRPGLGGIEGSNNQAKIDEEYMSLMAELGEVQPIEAQRNEPQQPASKPYNIFDTPRHQQQQQQQQSRAICPPQHPPMNNNNNNNNNHAPMQMTQPPWHQPNQPSHPMGSYPPSIHAPINSHAWPLIPPNIAPQMSLPPPPIPGTELLPPGTEIESSFKSWNAAPPLPPSNNFWGGSDQTTLNPPLPRMNCQPPLPSFLPPPPPPE